MFTDIQLGGQLNGWDVAEAFRRAYPQIRVIYTSGLKTARDECPTASKRLARHWFFVGFGSGHFAFHSRASFRASAICMAVITEAMRSRISAASLPPGLSQTG